MCDRDKLLKFCCPANTDVAKTAMEAPHPTLFRVKATPKHNILNIKKTLKESKYTR
jgi:hypothetical protein